MGILLCPNTSYGPPQNGIGVSYVQPNVFLELEI